MSERYGTFGELQEVLEGLEDYVRDEIDKARAELQQRELVNSHDPRYNAGRIDALRDVLDYLGVSETLGL